MKLENYADEIITKKYESVYWGGIYKVLNKFGVVKWVTTDSKNEVVEIADSYNEILEGLIFWQNQRTQNS